MTLGKDLDGNIYIYFPQFCGDDLRLYRHRQYGEPEIKTIPEVSQYLTPLDVNGAKDTDFKNDNNTQIQQKQTEEPVKDEFRTENSKSNVQNINNEKLTTPKMNSSPVHIRKENNVPDDIDKNNSDSNEVKSIDVNEVHSTDSDYKIDQDNIWNMQRKSRRKRNEKIVAEAANYGEE